jgi:hypothetical protein
MSAAIISIILIAVAVVAGGAVAGIYFSQASTSSLKTVVSVDQLSLIKQSNGETWFVATIKNNGNKQITSSTVELQVDTNAGTAGIQPFTVSPSPALINPGQSSSASGRVVDSGGAAITSLNYGDVIPVAITVTSSDGSTSRTLTSVTVTTS